jgi:hypothetical protein
MITLSTHCYTDNAVTDNLRELEGNYLEIGTFNGTGAAGIARQYPNRTIYVVDPFIEDGNTVDESKTTRGNKMPTQKSNALQNFGPLSNVVLFEQTSDDFAKQTTDDTLAGMNVRWVLIDGSHHFEDVVVDYNLAMRLLGNRSGIIVFDDLRVFDVANAYNQFQTEFGYRVQEFVWVGNGAGILVKIKANE